MKSMKRAATGIVFSAVLALSLVATSGQAFAASVDTRDGGMVAQGTLSKPKLPALVIKIILQPFGVSWED